MESEVNSYTSIASIFPLVFASVVNVYFIGSSCEMSCRLQSILTSKLMYSMGLKPCPVKRVNKKSNIKCGSTLRRINTLPSSSYRGVDFKPAFNSDAISDRHLAEARKLVSQDEIDNDNENLALLWKYCALVLDRVFLIGHVAICMTVLIYFFLRFY